MSYNFCFYWLILPFFLLPIITPTPPAMIPPIIAPPIELPPKSPPQPVILVSFDILPCIVKYFVFLYGILICVYSSSLFCSIAGKKHR